MTTFATLHEAWGMPETDFSPGTEPGGGTGHGTGHGMLPGLAPQTSPGSPTPDMTRVHAPSTPTRARAVRRYLQYVYDSQGLPGLLRLLPRRARHTLRRGSHDDRLWGVLSGVLSHPDVALFLLLLAFAMVVMWDA
jgi:hypothetical protein